MSSIIPYCMPLVLIILSLVKPKSKLLYWIIMCYICILITFNTWAPDFEVNKWMYNEINLSIWSNFEPGSVLIAKLCNSFGFSFAAYRGVISIIFLVIFSKGIFKLTSKRALAASVALIYPCVLFASGLRSAIAFSICIFSYQFLIGEKTSKKWFIVTNIAGMLFHYSAIFNLIYILWDKHFTSKKYATIIGIEVVGLVLLRTNQLFSVLSKIAPGMKGLEWVDMGKKESPSLVAFLAYASALTTVFFSVYLFVKFKDIETKRKIKKLIMLDILYIPLLAFNFTFERALIFGIYFLFIYSLDQERCRPKQMSLNNNKWLIKRSDVIIVLLVCAINILSYYWINNNIYFPIFTNNHIFK